MSYVFDLILIALLAVFILRGWRRGFTRSILGLGRLVLTFVITATCGSAFADWLDKTFINPPVYDLVHSKLASLAEEAGGNAISFFEKVPESFREHVDITAADTATSLDSLVVTWSHNVADGISGAVSTVIGYILLFILAFLVLTLVMLVVSKLVKMSPLATADKLLGLATGLLSGVLTVILVSVVLTALLSALGESDVAEASYILRLFAK